jgi:hypothetical protein
MRFSKLTPAHTCRDGGGTDVQRYHYQGIGGYEPAQAYQRGLADLPVLSHLIGETGFLFGANPTSPDAGIYGFIANIYFYDIETPLRDFVASQANFVRHCKAIHAAVSGIT